MPVMRSPACSLHTLMTSISAPSVYGPRPGRSAPRGRMPHASSRLRAAMSRLTTGCTWTRHVSRHWAKQATIRLASWRSVEWRT